MRAYRVLDHPDGSTQAVKVGFSWPAFVFGFFWCLAAQLWWQAALIAAGSLVFLGATWVTSVYAPDLLAALVSLGQLAGLLVALLCGFAGNGWRMSTLCRRGFRMRSGFVDANSGEEALRAAAPGGGSQAPGSA